MAAQRPPNIVLILSDQHRADWMGGAGRRRVETPNLDALAARGTLFAAAYANYPLCAPSRMSMMAGQHPHRLGVYINEQCLSSDVPTFAHALGLAGYETVLAGRMHFMGPDQRHGFARRLVGDICRCYAGGPDVDYGALAGTASNMPKAVEKAGPGDSPVLQYDEDVTRAAEEALRARGPDDPPLFLTVGWYGPHHPFTAPPDLYARAKARLAALGDRPVPHAEEPLHPWQAKRMERKQDVAATPERIAEVRANYAAMIDRTDQLVGRVLSAAEALPGETIVVYTSDHGESAGDHGMYGKGSFYEASIRVPLIVAPLRAGAAGWPAGGRMFPHPVSLVDLCPTLTELGGAPPLPLQDGRSLAPVSRGAAVEEAAWRDRPVWAEQELVFLSPLFDPIRMVRRGDWKLIHYHGLEPPHLFNLRDDPDEQRNRADDPACRAIRDELTRLVFDGWDPDALLADALRKGRDLKYLWEWGGRVGMGPLDLWRGGPPAPG
jgi:choline-sulfatase